MKKQEVRSFFGLLQRAVERFLDRAFSAGETPLLLGSFFNSKNNKNNFKNASKALDELLKEHYEVAVARGVERIGPRRKRYARE